MESARWEGSSEEANKEDRAATRWAIARARRSVADGSALSAAERGAWLKRFARSLARRAEDVIAIACQETGFAPADWADELLRTLAHVKSIERVAARWAHATSPWRWIGSRYCLDEPVPVGVVGVARLCETGLCWPTMTALRGLAVGCGVVSAGATQIPATMELLIGLARDAGLADDLWREVGAVDELLRDGADGLFIAGPADRLDQTGTMVGGGLRGWRATPWGDTFLVVLRDADWDAAARAAVVSAFSQAGQAGWGVRLCYVAREIEDEFHRRVVDLARSLEGRLARHDDHCRWVGPVRSTADVARLQSCVIKATQSGAKLLTGGGAGDARRRWYPPTVIARVAENDPLVEHGPQGPILATRVFDGEADLLTSVDSVEWVSLWSRNVRRARQWADNLAVGCVCINGRVRGEWDAVDHASVERALDEYVSRRRTIVTPTRHADACDLSVAKARAKAFRRFAS